MFPLDLTKRWMSTTLSLKLSPSSRSRHSSANLGSRTYRGAVHHWIGLRENLQETMVFTIKYRGVPVNFPIIQFYEFTNKFGEIWTRN